MTRLADQDDRDRIRNDLDVSMVVEAAAGTGKTSEVVKRILAAIEGGHATLDRIVAVTFTDAAAGELKLRIRAAIEQRRGMVASADTARRLVVALEQLEEARIGTIHGFCTELLHEYPAEAGVDPLFEVAGEDVAGLLRGIAFDRWFEAQLASPGPSFERIVSRHTRDGPRKQLASAARELIANRDFVAPWSPQLGYDRAAAIATLRKRMAELGSLSPLVPRYQKRLADSLFAIKSFVAELDELEATGRLTDDVAESRLHAFRARWNRDYRDVSARTNALSEVISRRDEVTSLLDEYFREVGATLAPQLRGELQSVLETFAALKQQAGVLDFQDLLLFTQRLLRENGGVRLELQSRFDLVVVDEFQDTDPIQAEILLLLAADDPSVADWRSVRPAPGKLFVVGDPKQSIYRFRRADVSLYEIVKSRILDSGGELAQLSVSFRAVPAIQAAVNAAFEPHMRGRTPGEPSYVPLQPFRTSATDQPAVVVLPVAGTLTNRQGISKAEIGNRLPKLVAGFVQWLVTESGWTVDDPANAGGRVPVESRHICILLRRFKSRDQDAAAPYIDALERHGIPHYLVGGRNFFERPEIGALRAVLAAIEYPDDELSVYAALRGPYIALSDAALLAYRARAHHLHPYRPVDQALEPALQEVAEALDLLRELHRGRNRRPLAETIGEFLGLTRAHAGVALWQNGEQALANLARLMDIARRVEKRLVLSFRGFVDWLEEQADAGDAGDAPVVEEGVAGVRMMTVHKAKGLEFPVVILADIGCNATHQYVSRWADPASGLCAVRLAECTPRELLDHEDEERQQELNEAVRVAYVAATRARELLVVPAVPEMPLAGSWLGSLDAAIYPAEDANAEQPPAGCPAVAALDVHESIGSLVTKSGMYKPQSGNHSVVWWLPAALPKPAAARAGFRGRDLLTPSDPGADMANRREHEAWQRQRLEDRQRASEPSIRTATATSLALQKDLDVGVELQVEAVDGAAGRTHGPEFGSLVHAVLAVTPLDADAGVVARLAVMQGRLLGRTPEEVEQATSVVERALAHPLLRRAAAADRCEREWPVAFVRDDGGLVEGIVDLAFLENGVWTVVDFKTDLRIGGRIEEYQRQVGLYVRAIEKATGQKCRGILLRL